MKGLKEIHEIMEKIYDDEKDLSNIQRMKMLKEESNEFISERKLNLKRVKREGLKQIVA